MSRRFDLVLVLGVVWFPLFALSLYWRLHPGPMSLALELGYMAFELAGIGLILFLMRRRGEPLRHVGLRRVRWWTELLWALAVYVACWGAWMLLDLLPLEVLGPPSPPLERPSGLYAAVLPLFLLVGASFEELLFRGYVWTRLARMPGRKTAALFVATTLFTAWHPYPARDLVYVFVFGAVLALFFWKGRSLPRLVLAHAALNFAIYFA